MKGQRTASSSRGLAIDAVMEEQADHAEGLKHGREMKDVTGADRAVFAIKDECTD